MVARSIKLVTRPFHPIHVVARPLHVVAHLVARVVTHMVTSLLSTYSNTDSYSYRSIRTIFNVTLPIRF